MIGSTSEQLPRLSSAQAAARLQIKLDTLYAYVSRGLLESERAEKGGSTFDPIEVEAFAASRRRGASSRATTPGKPLMVLESDLAYIEDDRLFFRGRPAEELARALPFEEAATFLWAGSGPHEDLDDRFVSRPDVVSAVRRAAEALGPSTRLVDHLPLAVMICGSWDPVRDAIGPAAVRDAGRQMIATMVDGLPARSAPATPSAGVAERLWPALCAHPASSQHVRLLNATMVLCMEHDLAISTMAARVAASARANPYAAVAAALSSFDSTVHGGASIPAAAMVEETIRTGNAEHALARQLTETGTIPGFGHVVYLREDPRARFLLDAMRPAPGFAPAVRAADHLITVVSARSPRPVNLDLALAALTVGAQMGPDAGELIFAIARTAGWIAHIIDEYSWPALRMRPQSRYTGPRIPPRR